MAFCKNIGSLMKQTISCNTPSMLNAIRCMSSSKLFIGGLSYSTDDHQLKEAFDSFGEVSEARVIVDRETGKSRGFGFVNYNDSQSATEALSQMDGQELNGRNIRVSYANERAPRPTYGGPSTGGGRYGNDGGF